MRTLASQDVSVELEVDMKFGCLSHVVRVSMTVAQSSHCGVPESSALVIVFRSRWNCWLAAPRLTGMHYLVRASSDALKHREGGMGPGAVVFKPSPTYLESENQT